MFLRVCVWLLCITCVSFAQLGFRKTEGNPVSQNLDIQQPGDSFLDCILSLDREMIGSYNVRILLQLAESYLEAGHKREAINVLSQAIQAVESKEEKTPTPNPIRDAFLRNGNGDFMISIAALYAKAGLYDQALQIVSAINENSAKASGLARIALELTTNGQNEKASELLSQALKALNFADDERDTISYIVVAYARMGQCDQALRIEEEISKEWAYLKARTLSEIASECAKAGAKAKALVVLSRALQVTQAIQRKGAAKNVGLDLKAQVLAEIAGAYVDAGEKGKATSLLLQAVQMARVLKAGKAFPLKEIARAYAKAGQYNQALQVAKSIDDRPTQRDAFVHIAREQLNAGQRQSGLDRLAQAFDITKTSKREDFPDVFKIEGLTDIAIEYAKAGENQKASEAILLALQVIRTANDYEQTKMLAILAKAFVKTKQAPATEAKELLRKICTKEPVSLTPEEQEKMRRAEEATARFIQRWHDTLDLDVLFDEMYVSNPEQRRRNINLFYSVYKFLSTTGYDPGVAKDIDEAIMRQGFMAFWNLFYLVQEYRLAFQNPEDQERYTPPEIVEAFKDLRKIKLNEKYILLAQVKEYIAKANHISSLLRKYLTRESFDTPLYKDNLRRCREVPPAAMSLQRLLNSKNKSRFRILQGFPEYGVRKEIEVYRLNDCLFAFFFVEEAGLLKVLTLGFEL